MMKEPNSELVTKQRTFSIDQSIESGMPRTYSVDSVDYTTMLMGDMEEEEKEEVRKKRKEWKSHKMQLILISYNLQRLFKSIRKEDNRE